MTYAANLHTSLARIQRSPSLLRPDAAMAEVIRTDGKMLPPRQDRHAGRALVTLHALTATGATLDAAVRNWCTMARAELARRTPPHAHYPNHATEIAAPRTEGSHP